jgi:hypothetical protein
MLNNAFLFSPSRNKHTIMSYIPEPITIYPKGTIVTTKIDPTVTLKVERYYQRIYYCSLVNSPLQKQLAYFNRELTSSA